MDTLTLPKGTRIDIRSRLAVLSLAAMAARTVWMREHGVWESMTPYPNEFKALEVEKDERHGWLAWHVLLNRDPDLSVCAVANPDGWWSFESNWMWTVSLDGMEVSITELFDRYDGNDNLVFATLRSVIGHCIAQWES